MSFSHNNAQLQLLRYSQPLERDVLMTFNSLKLFRL